MQTRLIRSGAGAGGGGRGRRDPADAPVSGDGFPPTALEPVRVGKNSAIARVTSHSRGAGVRVGSYPRRVGPSGDVGTAIVICPAGCATVKDVRGPSAELAACSEIPARRHALSLEPWGDGCWAPWTGGRGRRPMWGWLAAGHAARCSGVSLGVSVTWCPSASSWRTSRLVRRSGFWRRK